MAEVESDVVYRRSKSLFEIGIVPLGTVVVSLPLFGLVACVILSLLYDFESSTATHCGVSRSYRLIAVTMVITIHKTTPCPEKVPVYFCL